MLATGGYRITVSETLRDRAGEPIHVRQERLDARLNASMTISAVYALMWFLRH